MSLLFLENKAGGSFFLGVVRLLMVKYTFESLTLIRFSTTLRYLFIGTIFPLHSSE